MSVQSLEISVVRIDGDTQPRVAIDQKVVKEYAEAMQAGVEFPPVEVICDGVEYWLVDGFHRYFAHRMLDRRQLKATVTTGMHKDAQWQSLAANKTHGLRRSNDDKYKAVMRALKLRPDLSDGTIADHVGVHLNTVVRHRNGLSLATSINSVSRAPGSRSGTATSTNCGSDAPGPQSGLPTSINSVSRDPGSQPNPATPTNQVSHAPGPWPRRRLGRDGRVINTARIGQASRNRRRGGVSRPAPHPAQPGSPPAPTAVIHMPHDPELGARALMEAFRPEYLRRMIGFLTQHLEKPRV